ncbi:hypothetical protein QTH28_00240 [Clostridium perfringens]|nr:hypothetical protein [Clostridium perfringens]
MALANIPKLPEGIHAFFSIWEYKNGSKTNIKILSGDVPSIYGEWQTDYASSYYHPGITKASIKTNQMWDSTKQDWVQSEWDNGAYGDRTVFAPLDNYSLVYTNHDIKTNNGNSKFPKSSDATEIKIAGGDTRTMQKGMIWNSGEAITVIPSQAVQSCTFKSSNNDVCTVDRFGKITAVGEGDCVITIETTVF